MNYKSYIVEKDLNSLKNQIILFYGENLGLKNDFKKRLKLAAGKASIYDYTQDEILKNKNSFLETILNNSLFSEEKFYFIEQCNDKILDVIQEFEKKISDHKIYLFAETLDRKSKLRNYFEKSNNLGIVPCYTDNDVGLKKIIKERLHAYQGLTPENMNLLLSNVNLDRVKLNNELDKIETYFLNKKITKNELKTLLNLNENEDFNALKDAALNGSEKDTNKLLNETIIENDKIIYYMTSFNLRLNKLNEVLLEKNKPLDLIIDNMKPPIFWKDKPKFKEQAKKWTAEKIRQALKNTFELEVKCKSSTNLDKSVLLKKFIVDICNYANA